MKRGKKGDLVMDIYELIKKRCSVRSYKKDRVPDEVLKKIFDAVRLAPSANNEQPWKFVIVKDENLLKQLSVACHHQGFIAEAPVAIAACGLPNRSSIGGYVTSVYVDVAIAFDHLTLVSAEEGLGTCWIGAFDEKAVKKLLDVPENVRVVAVTPLGYPSSPMGRSKSRKDLDEIVCNDKYK